MSRSFKCVTCGHILGHSLDFGKTGRYDSTCHCGCTDWIPSGNLEYLEWCFEKKLEGRQLSIGR